MVAVMENVKKVLHDFQLKFPLQIEKRQKLNLFPPGLDEEELAECFYELYINRKKYDQYECDELKFSVFLYYLIKAKGFSGDNFSKTRFYEFIQKKVFYDLKQNVRTFNNHVNDLNILENAVEHPTDYAKHPDVCYFRRLKEKFQDSDYFMSLKFFFDRAFKASQPSTI